MGTYLNPGNDGFALILNDEYVDKTGLIDLINHSINTPRMLSCVSRPRRFGKSFAAKMLCAYYDCSCDSHALFDDKEIAKIPGYLDHLNQYNVISLDMTTFLSFAGRKSIPRKEVPNMAADTILSELKELYPECVYNDNLTESLIRFVEQTGRKIIFVIDEWDAPIREAKADAATQKIYLNLLREWFKNNNVTPRVVAAAYMTGILPIMKDGSHSAISDFHEFTVLNPGPFARYVGFTEEEVKKLCIKYDCDFSAMKQWYDGYELPGYGTIYNPYAVMRAIQNRKCCSYWRQTSAADSLMAYINMDFEGLQEIVSRLIAGEEIVIRTDKFANDFETFKSRDDVLTLLIHLGYLTWNEENQTARIPNDEVRTEFEGILDGIGANPKWLELIERSRKLLEDTLTGNAEAVAKAIDEIRDTQYAPTFYNNEQALRYVVKFAYIATVDQYLRVEELSSEKGIADVVYIPKKMSFLPALVIELKWNQSADGAIAQIKSKHYPAALQDFGGEILLVGINYDVKTKEHSCVIESINPIE